MKPSNWESSDSPLWDAKGLLDDAITAITPGDYDDALTPQEREVSLPLRGLGVSMSSAMKPRPDVIVPALDQAIIELKLMKKPSDRVESAIKKLKESREAFAALTDDPDQWKSDEDTKEDEQGGEAKEGSAKKGAEGSE